MILRITFSETPVPSAALTRRYPYRPLESANARATQARSPAYLPTPSLAWWQCVAARRYAQQAGHRPQRIPRPQPVDRHRLLPVRQAPQVGARVFFYDLDHLPHQRVLQLQLPYPPTQHIRVIAQRLAIGSGLRHGIPPFRLQRRHSTGAVQSHPMMHRTGADAKLRRHLLLLHTRQAQFHRATPRPQRYGRLGDGIRIPGIVAQPPFQTLSGRIPQMLHHLLRGHRCGEIQLHRPLTLLATGHGNNPSAQSPRKRPQPLIDQCHDVHYFDARSGLRSPLLLGRRGDRLHT